MQQQTKTPRRERLSSVGCGTFHLNRSCRTLDRPGRRGDFRRIGLKSWRLGWDRWRDLWQTAAGKGVGPHDPKRAQVSDDTSLATADTSAAISPGGQDHSERTSELGSLIRAKDWSTTPIGPRERWSPTLKTMVDFMVVNRFPLLLWWGPDYLSIYNDAYRPILGTKHPSALGQPFREVWAEIDHILRPLIDAPFNGGPAIWMDDILLEVKRHGFSEETHFTIAYSPVPDDMAPRGIGGVLATVHEITEKIVGERRITVLRDLGAHAGEARTPRTRAALPRARWSHTPRTSRSPSSTCSMPAAGRRGWQPVRASMHRAWVRCKRSSWAELRTFGASHTSPRQRSRPSSKVL